MDELIDVSSEDFGAILVCAERYACGRQTYMPSIVTGFIRPLLPYISHNSLTVMLRDLEGAYGYGNPVIDKPLWMTLMSDIRSEIERRKEQ